MSPLLSFFHFPSIRSRSSPRRQFRRRRGLSRLADERGMSLIELITVLGLIGLVGALAIPRLNSSTLDLSNTTQTFVADVRLARAYAVSRGAHYRVIITSNSYSVQRLQDDDGDDVWEPEGSPQTMELPAEISLSFEGGADGQVEFDTRGLVLPRPDSGIYEIEGVTISDAARGRSALVQVWPSGQVLEVEV
jgi:prepilin-type N-terminal cleavage/methylation domain-containing protein